MLVASGTTSATINVSERWRETEEKWGQKKMWDWHDDTPLIAATRRNHFQVVQYLLLMEADPTLQSCHDRNVYETAREVADAMVKRRKRKLDEVQNVILF